jgi:aryl-alcohol dehydrogenase-like predicted oxidoreductase
MKYSPAVLPIPGATRTEGILDCVSATEIPLSDEDFKHINENLPEQAEHSSE